MLIYFVEKVLFESCILLSRLATHGNTNQQIYRDLGQPWFYQPIFNKSWTEKKHHLRWRWIAGQFPFGFLVTELTQLFNLMFSGDSWGIWITCLSKDCTIHFLKKTVFMSGPPFLEPIFFGIIFYCSYDGITGHFLDPKWWIVLSCTCLLKKYMSKTSIHPFRKWIDHSNKTSNFTWFLHFLGFWLGQNFSI